MREYKLEQENVKDYDLSFDELVKLLENKEVLILAKLRLRGSGSTYPTEYVLCEPLEHPHVGGYSYKVLLHHSLYEVVVREMYTCTLHSLINEGVFSLIYKEDTEMGYE